MSTPSAQTIRRYALTGSVFAITATGAWYGAGLKTQQEFKQERKAALQISPTERIAQLEARKKRLVQQRTEMSDKIESLSAAAGGERGDGKTSTV